MVREATLATSLVIDFLGFLERQGHPLADVCRAADIDPAIVHQPNSRVPAAFMERLWPLAVQLTGDPDVGLHSAESYNPGALSIVGYVVLSDVEERAERCGAPRSGRGVRQGESAEL